MPAPGERLHRGFTCPFVTVGRRAVLVLAIDERPHPGHSRGRRSGPEDAADDKSIRPDNIVVVLPVSTGGGSPKLVEAGDRSYAQLMATYPALFDRALERPAFFGSR
jgi:hypothetical protein